ncbi:hypothetical protein RDWZM_001503 [Blomia tropicalis]|uniref:Vps16 C-terminal domain-containing protein n=1 Tax=Blomia tropicalis TaxID=40697 RepID=A0A9Q0MD68_BLOTA|nr:hypothetical protein RDWZM_001503 [Blomia tropicalis]
MDFNDDITITIDTFSTHGRCRKNYKCHEAEQKISQLVSSLKLCSSLVSVSSINNATISPRIAIERIFTGDHCVNLSVFCGKEQKLELLDYALLTGNSYVITKIILFLQETLKPSIFHHEISRRSVASDHYLIYLRNSEQLDKLYDTLILLGRHEEAAFAMFSRAINSGQSYENQIKSIRKTLYNSFSVGGPEILKWQPFIKDHITLLEQQLPIEVDDKRRETEEISRLQDHRSTSQQSSISDCQTANSNLFVIFPRPTLVGLSVIETLHYCCRYHYYLEDTKFASPFYIRKKFALTEKQFLWIALQALSSNEMWPEIDTLFEYKSWLGNRKIKNSIPIDELVRVLFHNSAPLEMLEKYLELVDDVERKLQLAKELLMTKFAADILIKLKDRKRLTELRASIYTSKNVDYVQQYIDNALKTSTIKWKN